MRNMKTCWSQSETLTTLERWQRFEPPSQRPRKEVTSGAGRINEAPIKSAMHKCWIRMKWVERNLMQLCRILLMTHALAPIDIKTNNESNAAWNGPLSIETGVANSSPLPPIITSSVSRISSREERFVSPSEPWTTWPTMSMFSGKLCRPSSSSISSSFSTHCLCLISQETEIHRWPKRVKEKLLHGYCETCSRNAQCSSGCNSKQEQTISTTGILSHHHLQQSREEKDKQTHKQTWLY